MMRFRCALLLSALWSSGAARADEGASGGDADRQLEMAKTHFSAGKAYYGEGRFDDALHEFGEAYRLSKKPALLYNIGLCDEHLFRYEHAIESMRDYLRLDPQAVDRGEVEAHVAELEVLAKKPAAPNPPADPKTPPSRRRLAGWVVGGSGVLLVGGAVATYLIARSDYNKLTTDCGPGGDACPGDFHNRATTGKALFYGSGGLVAAGGLAVAVSAVLLATSGRRGHESDKGDQGEKGDKGVAKTLSQATFSPLLLPGGGAGLSATISF